MILKPTPFEKKSNPALAVLREAGLSPKKVDEELNSLEKARAAFEQQGLGFEYLAEKVNQIIENGAPLEQMRAIEFTSKVLGNDVDKNGEDKAPTVNIVIQNASPERSGTLIDLLIPSGA